MSGKHLSPDQVLSIMRKEGKPADKLKRVEGVLNGTVAIHSVALRKKVKIPPNKATIYTRPVKNNRSSIFIEGMVEGKKATGILTNVKTSALSGLSSGRSASRSRSSSRRRSSSKRQSRSRSSSRRRSKSSKRRRSKSPKRRKSKSKRRRSSSKRRRSRRH